MPQTNGNGKKLPYIPFYLKDFWSDPKVMAMSYEQVGMYFKLLAVAWEQQQVGTLPCDDTVLAKYLGLLKEYWLIHRDTVMAAFCFEGGRWFQKRMVTEYEKIHSVTQKRSDAGKKGNESRWHPVAIANGSQSDRKAIARASDSDSDSLSASEEKKRSAEEKKGNSSSLKRRPASAGEVESFVVGKLSLTRNDALALWEHWLGNGFRNAGRPMANWQATASNWARRNWFFPSLQPTKREFSR